MITRTTRCLQVGSLTVVQIAKQTTHMDNWCIQIYWAAISCPPHPPPLPVPAHPLPLCPLRAKPPAYLIVGLCAQRSFHHQLETTAHSFAFPATTDPLPLSCFHFRGFSRISETSLHSLSIAIPSFFSFSGVSAAPDCRHATPCTTMRYHVARNSRHHSLSWVSTFPGWRHPTPPTKFLPLTNP